MNSGVVKNLIVVTCKASLRTLFLNEARLFHATMVLGMNEA